tara:strand:+ start:64 stop:345 length:282 start_codon:yes stop_codon:yes gene_type:complete
MTPAETYAQCKSLQSRKIELMSTNLKSESIKKVLDTEFATLREKKPVIYKNFLLDKINLEQFKQFAESAQSIMSQLNDAPNKSGKPPPPVVFE